MYDNDVNEKPGALQVAGIGGPADDLPADQSEPYVGWLVAGMDQVFQTWRLANQAFLDLSKQKVERFNAQVECAERYADVSTESGDQLRQFLSDILAVHLRLDNARKSHFEAAKLFQVRHAGLVQARGELKALSLRTSAVTDSVRLKAALQLAQSMVNRIDEELLDLSWVHLLAELDRIKVSDKRKVAPPRCKQEPLLKALSDALERVILVHEKALAAMNEAKAAVDTVDELATKKIMEPQKPTSEEVSRYINDLRTWAEANLPAQRAAGKFVQTIREYQATLERDLTKAQLAYDRVERLKFRAVEYDVDALITGAKQLLDAITKITRPWRFLCNSWAERKFDKSKPVTDTKPDELEAIEHLQSSIKNISIAVANKCNARLQYQKVITTGLKPARLPARDLSIYENNLESAWEEVEKILEKEESARARAQKKQDERDIVWDTYQARIAATRQTATTAMKLAVRLEKTLLPPRSDELTIVLSIVAKLYSLHAGIASYMRALT